MDILDAYLDTMFSSYPTTPRLTEAKAELRAMMEDAFTAALDAGKSRNEAIGEVIAQFGNLDELAPVLGISTEIRGDDGASAASAAASPDEAAAWSTTNASEWEHEQVRTPALPPVSLDEAESYAEARRRTQPTLAAACAALVASPCCLVALASDATDPGPWGTSPILTLVGLLVLLVVAAFACAALVARNRTLAPSRRLTAGTFTPTPEVDAWAETLRESHEPLRTRTLAASVALWVLAVVPTITAGILSDEDGPWPAWSAQFGVALTLVIAAIGVYIHLRGSWANRTAAVLSGRVHHRHSSGRDRADGSDRALGLASVVASIYWPLLTAAFLLWGFGWNGWDRAWILWPVGAVLFGAISAGTSAWDRSRRTRAV